MYKTELIKAMVKKGVSFKMESELIDLEEQVALLTDWERNAMEYYDDLVKYRADYDKFVQDKITDLQAKLDALPALDQIRVASEKDINAAKSAYDSASDYVRSKVTGAEKLSAAVTKLEQVLKDAWQPCTNCGGDGKTEVLTLPAPARSLSLEPSRDGAPVPYALYDADVNLDNYYTQSYIRIPVFDGITSIQRASLVPLPENGYSQGLRPDSEKFYEGESPDL